MYNEELFDISLRLINELRNEGSWCGETHIQKCMYFLIAHAQVNFDCHFIMYKHGPYSFDFHDVLDDMRFYGFIDVEHQAPYGPKFKVSQKGQSFLKNQENKLNQKNRAITTIARVLGKKTVKELEKLATALFILKEKPEATPEERAKRMHELKRHIDIDEAKQSTSEFDYLIEQFSLTNS